MPSIKKLFAGIALVSLVASLSGCLPFMAVRAAKTVSDNASSPSSTDAKKTEDAAKPAATSASPTVQSSSATAPK